MLNINGELIKTFGSMLEATRDMSIPYQNIKKVILGKRKTAGGYIWSYSNKFNL
jgi:hypothetical protein